MPKNVFFRLGSTGPAVKQIQLALAHLGYPLTGTGYFGPATDTAVEAFQRRAGIEIDGKVGNETAAAIDRAMGSNLAAVPPTVKEEISAPLWLQAGLKLLHTPERVNGRSNPEIIEWAKEEGGDIAKEYTNTATAWCALGVDHCLTLAGIKGTGTLWALDYANWGVPLLGPAVGAIAPMKRVGGGHVTIVAGKDAHGNLMCLGFNQGDTVSVIPFPASRPVAFRWPKEAVLPTEIGINKLPIVSASGAVTSKES